MADSNAVISPVGQVGGGRGGAAVNNNSAGRGNNNAGRGNNENNNTGRGTPLGGRGFVLPPLDFMSDNNFTGGFGHGRGDPNNYYGHPLDGGYGSAGTFNLGGGGQNNSLQVNVQPLDGSNYPEWSQTVRLILDGKGKLGFLTGDVQVPATTHPNYRFWKSENSSIIA